MLVSCVQSIYIRYIRTIFIFNESCRDCAREQDTKHQNCVPLLFSVIVSFLFRHWSMNHVLPFPVCGDSSEDSLPSGSFQHWSLYYSGGTRHRGTTNGVESFSGILTEAIWSYKNPRTSVAPSLLQLRYYPPQGSEETSGELRCISCYCHALTV